MNAVNAGRKVDKPFKNRQDMFNVEFDHIIQDMSFKTKLLEQFTRFNDLFERVVEHHEESSP